MSIIRKSKAKGTGRPSFVYVIQMNCSVGFVKIGITNDAKRRIAALQTSNPYALEVVRLWGPFSDEYARRLEARLHAAFEDRSGRGEWFSVAPEEVSAVAMGLGDMAEPDFRAWVRARRFEGA